jgi:hypothetical protein
MDAILFLCRREDAREVAASDDLPVEPCSDPVRVEDATPLAQLASILGVDRKPRPLRDASCRSFPVWDLGSEITRRIAQLDDAEIDDAAERWLKDCETSLDADLYELACCLGDLRAAIRQGEVGETLFVLLEERAW